MATQLFDYQTEAVSFFLQHKKVLISAPVGSGKTFIAGGAITKVKAFPVLIVTLTSVKQQFANELIEHFNIDEDDIQVVSARSKIDATKKIIIINPDILKKFYDKLRNMKFKFVIADESHLYKNHKSIRSKVLLGIAKNAEWRILMTGTVIVLGVIDVFSQLQILHPETFGSRTKAFPDREINYYNFAVRYCAGKQGHFGFECKGATNIPELLDKTKNMMFTLREEDVLSDLPTLQIEDIDIRMTNAEQKKYDIIKDHFKTYLREIGKTEYEVYKSMTNETLVKLNELRKFTSEVKLKHILDMLKGFPEEKVVLFFSYTASVEYFKKKLGNKAVTIIGSDSEKKRQENIDAFKNDSDVKYLLANSKAGGAGLNLQNAHIVIFAELPWAWADFRQNYGRCWRKKQTQRVMVYKPMVANTVDEKIDKIIYRKKAQSELIIN